MVTKTRFINHFVIKHIFFEKSLGKWAKHLYYAITAYAQLFPGSSAVEHSTVNRMVAGSNPARGAKFKNHDCDSDHGFLALRNQNTNESLIRLAEFCVNLDEK